MKKIALEETTNTHQVEATEIIKIKESGSMIVLRIEGPGVVTHGEHGPIVTESKNVIKYLQKETNPITKAIEDAND